MRSFPDGRGSDHRGHQESFLHQLAQGLPRGNPMKWADCVFTGAISGTELQVFDVSGEIELGAKLVGVTDDALAPGTVIVNQLAGDPGGSGRYLVNRAQIVPRSLLGAIIS